MFLLDGEGIELELPAPSERVPDDDGRASGDRRAAGRELQTANERLARRVDELERELEARGEELGPQLRAGGAEAVLEQALAAAAEDRARLEGALARAEAEARAANDRAELLKAQMPEQSGNAEQLQRIAAEADRRVADAERRVAAEAERAVVAAVADAERRARRGGEAPPPRRINAVRRPRSRLPRLSSKSAHADRRVAEAARRASDAERAADRG